MSTETDALLEGVLRGDSRALRAFLLQLRPHCVQKLFDRFGYLEAEQAEILDDAESLLFEWSLSVNARRHLPEGESLGKLAFRLLAEVVRRHRRAEKSHARLVRSLTASPVVSQVVPAPTFETEAIVALIASLPQVHREALTAEVCFQRDGQPRPAEAMGVSEGTARVRLVRARLALVRALKGGPLDPEASDG